MENLQRCNDKKGYSEGFQAFLRNLSPDDKELISDIVSERIDWSPISVLDIGIGNGLLSSKIISKLSKKGIGINEWCGIECHPCLEKAVERLKGMPFVPKYSTFEKYHSPGVFDFVLASHVFYHIPLEYNGENMLRKVYNLTGRVGCIIIQSDTDLWNRIKKMGYRELGEDEDIIGTNLIRSALEREAISFESTKSLPHNKMPYFI
ncbi:MAG: hypothetical protein AABX47_06750 [Nanoarchaeota archaeon]